MKNRVLQVAFLGILISLGNFSFSQIFKEDFNGEYLYGGWKFLNNSSEVSTSPQAQAINAWNFGNPNSMANTGDFTTLMDVRNPFPGTNPSNQKLTYLYTGFNYGSDVHGSTLSKWAISPPMYVKNGDVIRFRTRQRSTGCNNANRLEVRLSTHRDAAYSYGSADSTLYLPYGANEVGNFTNLLATINPNQVKTGTGSYPNEWTIQEVVITGLGTNEYYWGRIAFRYYVTDAGTAQCMSSINIPSIPQFSTGSGEGDFFLSSAIDLGVNITEAVCDACGDLIEVGGAVLTAYEMGAQAANTIQGALASTPGEKGSAIGIDDIEVVPRENVYMFDYSSTRANTIMNVFDKRNLSNTVRLRLGYKGTSDCAIDDVTPTNRRFSIRNMSNAAIKVKPHLAGLYGHMDTSLVLTSMDSITIPANGSVAVTLTLNNNLAIGTYYSKFWITDKNNQTLALANFEAVKASRGAPIARCNNENPIQINLDANGSPVTLTGEEVNDGSTNGCGGTDGLSFNVSKWVAPGYWAFGNNTFSCNDIGDNQVRLRVFDAFGTSAECYANVKVSIATPSNVDPTYVQNYYIGQYGSPNTKMAISQIAIPPVTTGCSNATPELMQVEVESPSYPGFYYQLGTSNSLGVGKYYLRWQTKINNQVLGGGTTILNVIDTIKPTIMRNSNTDTTLIGFVDHVRDEITGRWYDYVKTHIKGEDIARPWSFDNTYDYTNTLDYTKGVVRYQVSTPWYNAGAWVDQIPFNCSQIGQKFQISVRGYDASGNSKVLLTYAKIMSPANPSCKNIEVELDTWFESPQVYVTGEEVLNVGSTVVCGSIHDVTISKTQFTCADMGQTIPVTVTYKNPQNVQFSCVGSVKVKPFTLSQENCVDSVVTYTDLNLVTGAQSLNLPQVFTSNCSYNLPVTYIGTGASTFNTTTAGSYTPPFNLGSSTLTRQVVYNNETLRCTQSILLFDTVKPKLTSPAPQNITINLPTNGYDCLLDHEIVNCFEQSFYQYWGFEITGTMDSTAIFRRNFYDEQHWLNKIIEIEPGVYNIKVFAVDLSGNRTDLTYTLTYNITNTVFPYFHAAELVPHNQQGQECSDYHIFNIESPMTVSCNQTPFMWYYEVRDGYMGNIVYEEDSIPEGSGASIPIKVGTYGDINDSYEVHFGYHDKTDAHRIFRSNQSISFQDMPNTVTCPRDTVIYNYNNTTFTSDFEIQSPVESCPGTYWGYSVGGVTTLKSVNEGVNYTDNQDYYLAFGQYNNRYPSNAYNANETVTLNNGLNTITYSHIEASGNGNPNTCSFKITLIDASSAAMTCPQNDTIHRSDLGSCTVDGLQACQQISGFTGPYGTGRFRVKGSNARLRLETNDMPNSVTIRKVPVAGSVDYNDGYIQIKPNCSGTISFNYEYRSEAAGWFRPFIKKGEGSNLFNNFNQGSTGIQSGSVSINVSAGETVNIGVFECGFEYTGYFKITNLSAPSSAIVSEIEQPIYSVNNNLFFEHNVQAEYPIGNHQIIYKITNLNNYSQATCVQNLTVVDDHAGSLACQDKTVNLDQFGSYILTPGEMISTCFNVSNTWMTMDTLSCADVGTHVVTINSYDNTNQLLTCNFNLTVVDNTPPRLLTETPVFELDYFGNSATLSDSLIESLFYDACGITSVSASRTNFDCANIGINNVTLTVTDVNGNVTNQTVKLNVALDGFEQNIANESYEVCQGSTQPVYTSGGHSFTYFWQRKDKIADSLSWNFYSSDLLKHPVPGETNYEFVKDIKVDYNYTKKGNYLVAGSPISFYKLDTVRERWDPTDIAPFTNSSKAYKIVKNGDGEMFIMNLRADNNTFEIYKYDYAGNSWSQENTYTNGWLPYNYGVDRLYGNDDYLFTVSLTGDVVGWKTNQYFLNSYQSFHKSNAGNPWDMYITNAKNIVGLRNGAGQNLFFKINMHANGHFLQTKDSLTVDPTGNSDLFVMHSKNNEAYIAYRSSNGKACVKKFDGTSSWSTVGSLDFSSGTISSIDMKAYDDTLYVIYEEGADQIVVKKFNGSQWVSTTSPHTNLYISSFDQLRFVELNKKPQFLAKSNSLNRAFIVSREGWRNVSTYGSSQNYYNVPTNTPGTEQYRCFTRNSSACASSVSGVKTVTVKELPVIQANDFTTLNAGPVSLTASTNAGTIRWASTRDGLPVLATGSSYIVNGVTEDTAFYAYAKNAFCSSDTVKMNVFLNDEIIPNLAFTHPDTICSSEGHQIVIDTNSNVYNFYLYSKNSNGEFVYLDGPNPNPELYIYPSQTTTYKVLVEELKKDHYSPDNTPQDNEHLDFGNFVRPSSNAISIEAMVYVGYSTSPTSFFALTNSATNASHFSESSMRNFEWYNGKFIVHNGNTSRELNFPNLPGTQQWVHVATVAGPDGMEIYYNGTLVASNSLTASGQINNAVYPLKVLKSINGLVSTGIYGFDEFKIWNSKRSSGEVLDDMTACITDFDESLVQYTNFKEFNTANKQFAASVGNTATMIDRRSNAGNPHAYRGDDCGDTLYSKRFLPEFTVHVLGSENQIVSSKNYPYYEYDEVTEQSTSNLIEVCGPVTAPVEAIASAGTVYWYDSETGGNLIGTGTNLNFYAESDTVIYASASPKCYRTPVNIQIINYPSIADPIHDTICIGDAWNDVQIDVNEWGDNTNDFDVYLTPTGGSPFDYQNDYTELTEDDTVYLEAYNQYCTASERIPFYIHLFKTVELNIPDTTYCGPTTVDFAFSSPGIETFEWYTEQNDYIDYIYNGDTFTTASLTDTTIYHVVAYHYEGGCYSNPIQVQVNVVPVRVVRDSILSCSPITWRNGETYRSSVNEVIYTKTFDEECDSTYILNLQVGDLEGKYVTSSASGACIGQTVDFTVYQSQAQKSYVLVDLISGDTLDSAIGDGNNLVLQTTALAVNMNVKVVALDSLVNPNQVLVCEKNLGTFSLVAGQSIANTDIITCDEYEWRGNTYTSSGVYEETLTSVYGCDSILRLNLTLNQSYNNVLNVTACDSYTYRGVTYTASTQIVHRFGFTTTGCDSLETLNLTIGHPNTGTDVISACGSHTWIDGITYTSSNNTATFVLPNMNGCDSTVTLNLTIKNSNTGTDVITACGSYTWIDGITYTSSNNTATHTLMNVAGCDSIVTLNLTINASPSVDAPSNVTTCDSYTLPILSVGNYYSGPGGTGTAYFAGTNISSSMTMYVYATNGTCSDENSFTISVNASPSVLSSMGSTRCWAGTLDLTATTNIGTLNWYSAATGGTLLGSGNTFTTPSIATSTSYWVEANNSGCKSARIQVVATVEACSKVVDAQCGTTINTSGTKVYCNNVTALSGTTNYKFRIVSGAVTQYYISTNRWFTFDNISFTYGTPYTVDVAVDRNGGTNFGLYGASCTVTSPVTKLTSSFCNSAVVSPTVPIYCFAVPNATKYRFRIFDGSVYRLVTNTTNSFTLSQIPYVHGTNYTVTVAQEVGGVFSNYGEACTVFLGTKIVDSQCGATINSRFTNILCNAVPSAIAYRFKIVNGANTYYVDKSVRYFTLNDFAYSFNTTYSVSVAVNMGSGFLAYGPACNITTPATSAIMVNDDIQLIEDDVLVDVQLETYPNPNDGDFTISSTHEGSFKLVNELGQLIQTIEITKDNNYRARVENIGTGVYFVTGTINNELITKKVIVTE